VVKQHERILEAVKKREAVRAGSLMRKHLESSMKALYRDKQ
jgi:DNA-binding GntR family transcriptional regulator